MKVKGLIVRLARVAIILLVSFLSHAVFAQEQRVVVVANSSVTNLKLSSNQLRKIFSMRQTTWPDGQPIQVYVLPTKSEAHSKLCKDILKMFPYQIDRLWNKLAYSGLGETPIAVETAEQMRLKIASTPGAIGYVLSSGEDNNLSSINVIKVE